MRIKILRILVNAIVVLALAPIATANANYKDIPKEESNFQYIGEVTRSQYRYVYNNFGSRYLINIYGKTIGQLHHHRAVGLYGWSDHGAGKTFVAVTILNSKKMRLKISSKGALDFVRTRYFDAVDYIPFDGEWVKSGEKLKCFVFDGVYENLSRVLGWFCRRQGPSFDKVSVTDFFNKLRYSDDGFREASKVDELKPTNVTPATKNPAAPITTPKDKTSNAGNVEDRLRAVKRFLDEGLITVDEARQKRKEIMGKM